MNKNKVYVFMAVAIAIMALLVMACPVVPTNTTTAYKPSEAAINDLMAAINTASSTYQVENTDCWMKYYVASASSSFAWPLLYHNASSTYFFNASGPYWGATSTIKITFSGYQILPYTINGNMQESFLPGASSTFNTSNQIFTGGAFTSPVNLTVQASVVYTSATSTQTTLNFYRFNGYDWDYLAGHYK